MRLLAHGDHPLNFHGVSCGGKVRPFIYERSKQPSVFQPPENDAQFASMMNNISALLFKVAFAQNNPMAKQYQQSLLPFVAELKSHTAKLIQLCGREACVLSAKTLLGTGI